MEPAPITTYEWVELSKIVNGLFAMVALVVFMSTNLIVGHMLIPSLVSSNHLPGFTQKFRLIFYILAVAAFSGAVLMFFQVLGAADVISRIYDTYWIDGGTDAIGDYAADHH